MKSLATIVCAFVLFSACSKNELEKWTKRGCDIAEQVNVISNGKTDISRGVVKKTYNADGSAKSLSVRSVDAFNYYDSMYCTFEYQKNAAVVRMKYISRRLNEETGEFVIPGEVSNYTLSVTFDPVTGFATRVGDDVVTYENKKVKSFGNLTFSYDSYGNLTSIYKNPIDPGGLNNGEQYSYDLNTKAAKNEVYTPWTLAVSVYKPVSVNAGLAEIMRWLPTESPYRRIKREKVGDGYVLDRIEYSNHQYKDGKLISFSSTGSRIQNTWKCY